MNDLPTRRAFNRAGAAALERQIDGALDQLAAERRAQHTLAREYAEKDRQLEGSVTREQLVQLQEEAFASLAGITVRDATGWHPVLRINPKSVTVPGPWGGTRTIRIDRIRQVRP